MAAKSLFIFLLVLVLTGCTQIRESVFTPSDIERYCHRIFGDSDDSISTCIKEERSAKNQLSGMRISPDIEKRCRRLSESTGGSYQVMLTCVQQEMKRK